MVESPEQAGNRRLILLEFRTEISNSAHPGRRGYYYPALVHSGPAAL